MTATETVTTDFDAITRDREWATYMIFMSRAVFAQATSEDTKAIQQSVPMKGAMVVTAGIKHLSAIIGQLIDLLNMDESDEYGALRATKHAYNLACDLLQDAAIISGQNKLPIPYACASTDSEGGVRIEWVRQGKNVHLIVPASAEKDAYIYHARGKQYAIDSPATAEGLSHWLQDIE